MKYLSIDDLHNIPEKLQEEFFLAEARCWGSEPFNEFAICADCGRIHSIEDCKIDDIKIGDTDFSNISCLECKGSVSSFYLNKDFKKEAYEYFKQCVRLVLLLSNQDELLGFGLIIKKKIQDVLEYEFSTRPKSYDFGNISESLQLELGTDLPLEQVCLCIQHIYIDPQIRRSGFGIHMLRKMLEVFSSSLDRGIILETRFDSSLYPLTRSLGFKNIGNPDQYGYVIQLAKNAREVALGLERIHSGTDLSQKRTIQKYRQEAKRIIGNTPSFSGKRFYYYE